jgi:MFS family permease
MTDGNGALRGQLPDLLQERGFAALWLAEAVSRLGDGIHEIAILWLVYEVTGDPVLLSLVVVSSVLPSVLVSMPAGVLVDRLNRVHVMIVAHVVRAGVVLAIPMVGDSPGLVAVVVAVAAIASTMEAFFRPAREAIVPNLVGQENLDAANSLLQITDSASKMLYAAGGIVVGVFGSFAAFYVDAASFLVSASLLVAIPAAAGSTESRGDKSLTDAVGADVIDGLRYVWQRRVLLSVVLMWTLTGLAMGPLGVVIPVFTRSTLNAGSTVFGLLYAAIYVGIFVGSLLLSRFDAVVAQNRGRFIVVGVVAAGSAFSAAAILPIHVPTPLVVAGLAFLVAGLFVVCIWVPARAITQEVPDDVRGRVAAVVSATGTATLPIGVALVGPALTVLSAREILIAEGVLLVVSGLALAFTPLAGATSSETPAEA